MQEVFYTIIEEQTKNKMVAAASPDYAFRALGPIMIPEEKSKPHRALICVVSVFIGGVFSVMLVLLRHIYGLSTRRISDNHEKYKWGSRVVILDIKAQLWVLSGGYGFLKPGLLVGAKRYISLEAR